ncbi:MAG: hypothetical protein ABIM85_03090 [candidate division WOR-3 bacterium]
MIHCFFYIKEEFKVFKNGKPFMKFTKKIICFDIKNLIFNEIDTLKGSFTYKEEKDIEIYCSDTLNLLKAAFLFDKIKTIFDRDTGALISTLYFEINEKSIFSEINFTIDCEKFRIYLDLTDKLEFQDFYKITPKKIFQVNFLLFKR